MTDNKPFITLSACFLPPRQTGWVEKSGPHYLPVPFKTSYIGAEGNNVESVVFDPIRVAQSIGDVIDFASILETMFAMGRYPKLEDNELFCLRCVVMNYDKEELVLVGHIFTKEY